MTEAEAQGSNSPRVRLLSTEAQAMVARLGVAVPDSAAVAEAEEMAFAASTPELYGHAVRSYLYSALLATAGKIKHDGEMLAVGSLLHDVGLTSEYEQPDRIFEHVSADQAASLSESYGWELRRRYTLHRAIVLHMAPSMPPAEEAEVVLLEAGVACDVSGRHQNELTPITHQSLVQAFPRPQFAVQFVEDMRTQAERHPASHAAIILENGIAESISRHQGWIEELTSAPVPTSD